MATAAHEIRALDDTLRWAHQGLGLTYEQIGALLDVSERTLRRWRTHDHRPRPRPQQRLEDLRELRHLLEEVFPAPEACEQWLYSPTKLLRGRTPIAELRAGRIARVVDALATFESGAFL